jgi:hypothetical protein
MEGRKASEVRFEGHVVARFCDTSPNARTSVKESNLGIREIRMDCLRQVYRAAGTPRYVECHSLSSFHEGLRLRAWEMRIDGRHGGTSIDYATDPENCRHHHKNTRGATRFIVVATKGRIKRSAHVALMM